MTEYLKWRGKTITDFSDKNINSLYNEGYVFTRLGRGVMHQTRSLRINLSKFELTSENRRVLKKNKILQAIPILFQFQSKLKSGQNRGSSIPPQRNRDKLLTFNYDWSIGKMAKDFYDTKFGTGVFTANKIKELFTDDKKSNFNKLLVYALNGKKVGYAICFETDKLLHYSYPFYGLRVTDYGLRDISGMAMMLKAILWAKENKKKYIYLGSAQRPTDIYKLQFKGLEWFDGGKWNTDINKLKEVLKKHAHFIGICGVAMSALAIALQKAGWRVSGSDAGFFPPISTHLKENDIDFYPGWHPERMGRPDLVVVGNVASSTNPEWIYTQKNKLNYKSYPEVIAEYFVKNHSIVAAGTYGKTSSSALLSFIFEKVNLDPSYMFGGLSQNQMDSASIGSSPWSILEGDEYKSSRWDNRAKFTHYSPTHLLLTSLVWDHADVYPTEKLYFAAFADLIKSMPKNGLTVANFDDKKVREMIKLASCKIVKYGKDKNADYKYHGVKQTKNGLNFIIENNDKKYKIKTKILGEYQAANITGCFALSRECEIEAGEIIKAILNFQGLKRRLEKRLDNGITIIDDIAHSPQKAQSVLDTLKSIYKGKLIAVFEPNTGNRKPATLAGYDNCFSSADTVIIPKLTKLKVDFKDREKPIDGDELAETINKTHKNVLYIDDDEKLIKHIIDKTKKNDCVVFLGSHGFRGMIDQLVTFLRQ